jgi:hypothetical protein
MRRQLWSGWLLVSLCCVLGSAPSASPQEIPAVVALVLDTSGSLSPRDLRRARELALGILENLPAGSQVAVLTFDDESRILVQRTGNAAEVRAALASVAIAGRYTALYDALFDSSRYLRDVRCQRSAIVLLTDGKDENSALSLEDGLQVAREHEIPVFTVGVGRRIQQGPLRRVAKLTGGRYSQWPEASGATLASWILATPARAAPAVAVTPAATPAATPAPRPGFRWLEVLLWMALGLGLVVTAVALGLRARSLAQTRCPSCNRPVSRPGAPCPSCGEGLGGDAGTGPHQQTADETVVARQEAGTVDKTVVLAAHAVLAFTRGPRTGELFELPTATATSLGRGPENDIVVSDSAVSGQHCRIQPEGGRFVLHDLQSTNGTFVNERRIGRQLLSEGDVIRLGDTWIEIRTP